MNTVKVGNVDIGAGSPKVIIPIVGKTEEEILKAAQETSKLGCDLVEWRIDHYEDVDKAGAVSQLSPKVKQACGKPLLVTFRSKKEGGVKDMSDEDYLSLYEEIIANGEVDLIDLELYMPEEGVSKVIQQAQAKGVKVVMSNHDFDKTPAKDDIVNRLALMEDKGADIAKIAVMPNSSDDVLTLLEATNERKKHAKQPLITMSMGQLGMVSRISGEVFGSAASFGSAGEASAPGQMPVEKLNDILQDLAL